MSDSIERRHFMAAPGSLVAGASLAPPPGPGPSRWRACPRSPQSPAKPTGTVHPLGGYPMADRADDGVVDAGGQVFDPRAAPQSVDAGLRVIDAAIVPASLGANPLLTIAAPAERAAERYCL
ncbi:hypothetical protein F2P45_16905 [Massilia sp. CCM 8733]|uniref:Cholesterol oxidase n=1 Tax=Massilia mucilaginosa TaxID=2609282 RepID=A0ABX0NW77_9BURK|nr:GMC oxidoreductase [Massilia mucilaginosa]NHZ90687.1 hypothetical protein [Massilia mucilaginosa]